MLKYTKTKRYEPLYGHTPIAVFDSIIFIPTKSYIETNPEPKQDYDSVFEYNKLKHFVKLKVAHKLMDECILDLMRIYKFIKANYSFITNSIFQDALTELTTESKLALKNTRLKILNEKAIGKLNNDFKLLSEITDGRYPQYQVKDKDTMKYFQVNNDTYGIYFKDIQAIAEPFKMKSFLASNANKLHLYNSSTVGWFSWQLVKHIEENNIDVNYYETLKNMLINVGNEPTYFINKASIKIAETDEKYTDYNQNLLNEIRNKIDESPQQAVLIDCVEYGDFWSVIGTLENNGIKIDYFNEETKSIICIGSETKKKNEEELKQILEGYIKNSLATNNPTTMYTTNGFIPTTAELNYILSIFATTLTEVNPTLKDKYELKKEIGLIVDLRLARV